MRRERIVAWSLALGWLGLIYGTLYIVRPICEFLRQYLPLSFLINLFLILTAVGLGRLALRKCSILGGPRAVLFILALVAYGLFIIFLKIPEEKLHLLEYGFLAFLTFRAVRLDKNERMAYLLTFILVALWGWLDEGIQAFLPNRYYDTRDVVLNAIGTGLGLIMVFLFRGNRKSGGRAQKPSNHLL